MAVKARWKNSEFALPLCSPISFHSVQRTDLDFDPGCLCAARRATVGSCCAQHVPDVGNFPTETPEKYRLTVSCPSGYTPDGNWCGPCTERCDYVIGTHVLDKHPTLCRWSVALPFTCPEDITNPSAYELLIFPAGPVAKPVFGMWLQISVRCNGIVGTNSDETVLLRSDFSVGDNDVCEKIWVGQLGTYFKTCACFDGPDEEPLNVLVEPIYA